MATPTIRERIKAIQAQMMLGTFTTPVVRDNLIHLTGLLGEVQREHREADFEYNLVLDALTTELNATKGKVRAATTSQWQRAREAADTEDLVRQMIMGSKKYLESLDTEARVGG